MNAFEHQVADEVLGSVRPPRPVDVAAVVRAAVSTPPRWRFQSMFGATRFVVAGVIVALIGGVVLASVLTVREDDELRLVGASLTVEGTTLTRDGASPPPVDAAPTTRSSASGYRLPAQIPDGLRSGSLDTPLGRARWVHLKGRRGTLPPEISADFRLGDGYVLVEGDASMIWRSPDLLTWRRGRLPVESTPQTAWLGMTQIEDDYWLMATPPLRLWRSTDTRDWEAVDLGLAARGGTEAVFASSGDAHLLITDRPSSLWRSADGTDWHQLDLDILIDRLPETIPIRSVAPTRSLWRSPDGTEMRELDLDDPTAGVPADVAVRWVDPKIEAVTSGDATIMTLRYSADTGQESLPLSPLVDGWNRIRRFSPSGDGYEAWWSGGYATVRIEETGDELRIIEAGTDAELTRLPDIDVPVGERWPRRVETPLSAMLFAIVEDDALVPIDLPGVETVETTGLRTIVPTESGFEAYVSDGAGIVTVLASSDGMGWTEVRRLGDDPGEPIGIDEIRSVGDHLDAAISYHGGGWSSTDGIAWARYADPSEEGRLDMSRVWGGWLWLRRDRLSYLPDGQDEWLSVDASELGLCDRDCGAGISVIGPDTIVHSQIRGGEDGDSRRDHWIITFDELE